MMSHFNTKSLAFYGIAISSVLLLFKVVSAYGEENLKAQPAINGNYQINAQNLPGCLKADALMLNIQQSGRYLSGSLLPADSIDIKSAEKEHSLSGNVNNGQLSLHGSAPRLNNCNNEIKIEGRVEAKAIAGKIGLGSISDAVEFTAQQQEPAQQKKESQH
jgi:hypothetical protein